MKRQQTSLLFITIVAVVGLIVLGSNSLWKPSSPSSLLSVQPTYAQTSNRQEPWQIVYQQLPDLPLENNYVSKETGKVNPDSNLVSRLIRYHAYIKGRASIYRLDWKLTLADYLGVNEIMDDTTYPGYDNLTKNPIDGDRAAIARLNRKQRDALVQTLVNIFNPNRQVPTSSQTVQPSSNVSSPILPPQPQPGDAQLLKP